MKLVQKSPPIPFIRKLCAHLPEKEIEAAEVRFLEYVEICREIAEEVVDRELREEAEDFDKPKDHT